MAYEYRRIVNGAYGQLANSLSAVATSMTEPAFSGLPTIAGADIGPMYIPIALNDQTLKVWEVVWITAHAAGSATVTILRAQEGSTARAWTPGKDWGCNPLRRDGLGDELAASLPSSPHVGLRLVERDTGALKIRTLTQGWQAQVGLALPSDVGPRRDGATPPNGAAILHRSAGGISVTTNSVGDGFISFRQPFPTNCISVVANSADYTTFGGTCTTWSEGASGFDFRAITPGGVAAANATFKVSYQASGW